jgi:hypothetical protein
VYVRQQKAAEEQLRVDKTEKTACVAPKDNGGSLSRCPPRRCNLVGILLCDNTASVCITIASFVINVKLTTSAVIIVNKQ